MSFPRLLSFLAAALLTAVALAGVTYVPLEFRTVSGIRPFVHVRMNGKPFVMMVHSNANFFAMTTHDNAKAAGIGPVVKQSNYGTSAPGHVSEQGRGSAVLKTLQVGASIDHDVKLAVFETPHPDMQGMLGVLWLRANRAVVDFGNSRLGTADSAGDSAAEDRALVRCGFIAHPMRWDESRKAYFITATINGVHADFGVSTVADNVLDTALADALKIFYVRNGDTFDGPTGTEGDVFATKDPVTITVDGQLTLPERSQVFDFYAYNRLKRPTDTKDLIQGTLGSQFMLSNKAVIDFGTDTLFLLPVNAASRP